MAYVIKNVICLFYIIWKCLDERVSKGVRWKHLTSHIHTLWLGSFTPNEKTLLFNDEASIQINNGNGLDIIDKYMSDVSEYDPLNQLIYTYYQTYLLDDILVKVDRASMYNSLEVRAPFLDHRVVEFVNSLPVKYKFRGGCGKYILKKLMAGKLPDKIIRRPKKGFGIPLSYWLRNDLKPLCNELLSEESLSKHNYFNKKYIEKLKNDHFNVVQNNRKLLWTLMMFQMWYQKWMG